MAYQEEYYRHYLTDYGPDHYTLQPTVPIGAAEDYKTMWNYYYSIYDSHSRYMDPEMRYIKKICNVCRKVYGVPNTPWPTYEQSHCPYCGSKLE